MSAVLSFVVAAVVASTPALGPGNHVRSVDSGGTTRAYLLHVPQSYNPTTPTPLVVALHPFGTNARLMAKISGLSETAEKSGFLVVYPNGRGKNPAFLAWNEGGLGERGTDEVGYIAKVLDDVATVTNVDANRVFATGMSNGAMLCYRLASELSGRIAAIAPVAGTMAFEQAQAGRAVSVLHFHGTKDTFIPYRGPEIWIPKAIRFKSVDETIQIWAKRNGCSDGPVEVEVARTIEDGLRIKRKTYGAGRDRAEVVLYTIEGGGHTWPGRSLRLNFLGESALDLHANDLMWEFFRKHPRSEPVAATRPTVSPSGGAEVRIAPPVGSNDSRSADPSDSR